MPREIVMHLVAPRQLFVFDPAAYDPFDPEAPGQAAVDELFQLAHAGWLGTPRMHVTVYVPAVTYGPELEDQMRRAFMAHCEAQLAANRQAHREFLAVNVLYLAIAILVLAVGLWLQHWLTATDAIGAGELKDALQTGILVLIWVVVWTPVSGFVLEWVPFARTRRAYRTMLAMDLSVRPEERCPGPRTPAIASAAASRP